MVLKCRALKIPKIMNSKLFKIVCNDSLLAVHILNNTELLVQISIGNLYVESGKSVVSSTRGKFWVQVELQKMMNFCFLQIMAEIVLDFSSAKVGDNLLLFNR